MDYSALCTKVARKHHLTNDDNDDHDNNTNNNNNNNNNSNSNSNNNNNFLRAGSLMPDTTQETRAVQCSLFLVWVNKRVIFSKRRVCVGGNDTTKEPASAKMKQSFLSNIQRWRWCLMSRHLF
ncbi:unnamed protein product [Polarella glacialis]|uniref:Uncharacterized protein n=1 Tax=Polarella glacialis TaxID=89957 RepID=A0A813JMZ3_POLGL|nr:unnamed protein product [Polarella glacialis]